MYFERNFFNILVLPWLTILHRLPKAYLCAISEEITISKKFSTLWKYFSRYIQYFLPQIWGQSQGIFLEISEIFSRNISLLKSVRNIREFFFKEQQVTFLDLRRKCPKSFVKIWYLGFCSGNLKWLFSIYEENIRDFSFGNIFQFFIEIGEKYQKQFSRNIKYVLLQIWGKYQRYFLGISRDFLFKSQGEYFSRNFITFLS